MIILTLYLHTLMWLEKLVWKTHWEKQVTSIEILINSAIIQLETQKLRSFIPLIFTSRVLFLRSKNWTRLLRTKRNIQTLHLEKSQTIIPPTPLMSKRQSLWNQVFQNQPSPQNLECLNLKTMYPQIRRIKVAVCLLNKLDQLSTTLKRLKVLDKLSIREHTNNQTLLTAKLEGMRWQFTEVLFR